jgi:nitrogen fixation protein FixH
MKFNWGTGIFIFIVLFLAVCMLFLWYTRTMEINMVEEDYYPKELKHEEHMNKIRNADALPDRMKVVVGEELVSITMPEGMRGKQVTGKIHIYRPSDEKLDVSLRLATDTSGLQSIPRSGLVKGRYIVKVEWLAGKTEYYQEADIYIP